MANNEFPPKNPQLEQVQKEAVENEDDDAGGAEVMGDILKNIASAPAKLRDSFKVPEVTPEDIPDFTKDED